MLFRRIVVLLTLAVAAQSLRVYSSFWAPLFDRRILNYRVDVPFSPDAGREARGTYERMFGPGGENLIADLGNGRGLGRYQGDKNYGDVKFYYTYPGAPT